MDTIDELLLSLGAGIEVRIESVKTEEADSVTALVASMVVVVSAAESGDDSPPSVPEFASSEGALASPCEETISSEVTEPICSRGRHLLSGIAGGGTQKKG